jgi:hypothetical protein
MRYSTIPTCFRKPPLLEKLSLKIITFNLIKQQSGTTATFVSIEEEARINKKCNNKLKRKKKREQQQQQLMQLEVQPRKANRSRK